MPKFRRKNMDVIAVQLTRDAYKDALEKQKENPDELTEEEKLLCMVEHKPGIGFFIQISHGPFQLPPLGWIVKRGKNDIIPIGKDVFEEIYEAYEEEEESKDRNEDADDPSTEKTEGQKLREEGGEVPDSSPEGQKKYNK